MGRIKDTWYKLVAGGLLQTIDDLDATYDELNIRLVRQRVLTFEYSEKWEATEKQLAALKKDVKTYPEQISVLKEHVKAAKDGRTDDVEIAMKMMRERADMDPDWRGKLNMLRERLRQECAYILYLEEKLAGAVTEFNDLPQEERKLYFERVDERTQ